MPLVIILIFVGVVFISYHYYDFFVRPCNISGQVTELFNVRYWSIDSGRVESIVVKVTYDNRPGYMEQLLKVRK